MEKATKNLHFSNTNTKEKIEMGVTYAVIKYKLNSFSSFWT